MATPSESEFLLLGGALYAAQRIEFALYGLVAHASHLDVAKKDKRFRNLNPEKFLRGDLNELKATLGQLVEVFGDAFMLKSDGLVQFYKDRNLIAHDYYRTYCCGSDAARRDQAVLFLIDFIKRADEWEKIIRGLMVLWRYGLAEKEGCTAEIVPSAKDGDDLKAFLAHVAARTNGHTD